MLSEVDEDTVDDMRLQSSLGVRACACVPRTHVSHACAISVCIQSIFDLIHPFFS